MLLALHKFPLVYSPIGVQALALSGYLAVVELALISASVSHQ